MFSAHDVAAYILEKHGPMSAMTLQKLVYYCQAWSLVWDDRPMFRESIQAWANGPVVRSLYEIHRGMFEVSRQSFPKGEPARLDERAKETIDTVLQAYGDRSSQWLSDLTHSEAPWRDARVGVPDGARSEAEISHEAMAEFYGSLDLENATPLG